jgi:hypothetical protein
MTSEGADISTYTGATNKIWTHTKLYSEKKYSHILYAITFTQSFAKKCVYKESKYVYSMLDMFWNFTIFLFPGGWLSY